jgi:small-conductance mechanosensitive channel
MKNILRKLQLFDGIWSIPVVFFLFLLAGSYSSEYFGDGLISIEYIQQVILAALILIVGNFVVFLGGYFNFRGLQNYFYSSRAKSDLDYTSTPWQRIVLYVCVYFGLFLCFLFILWLIMTATVSVSMPPLTLE